MSIFGDILNKIVPNLTGSTAHAAQADSQTPSRPSPLMPETEGAHTGGADVGAILTDMATKQGQNLNWKSSIVDLMKLLDMDSGLQARKDLAKELGYTGDTNDSGAMNIWLHKQVMQKIAANGGKVPAELLH